MEKSTTDTSSLLFLLLSLLSQKVEIYEWALIDPEHFAFIKYIPYKIMGFIKIKKD